MLCSSCKQMHINSIWRFSIGFHIPTQYTLVPDNYASENFIEWFIKVKYSVIPFQQSVRRHWIFPNSRVHDIKDIDADVITQTWLNGKALSLGYEHDSLSYTYDKTLKTQTYTLILFDLLQNISPWLYLICTDALRLYEWLLVYYNLEKDTPLFLFFMRNPLFLKQVNPLFSSFFTNCRWDTRNRPIFFRVNYEDFLLGIVRVLMVNKMSTRTTIMTKSTAISILRRCICHHVFFSSDTLPLALIFSSNIE